MTLEIRRTTQFRRDAKLLRKQGLDLSKLDNVIRKLVEEETLEERYRDHALVGNWKGYRECHIAPDWLLIYKIEHNELLLATTGSHANLFDT